ncbi:MAG TPA: murein biosynthesis integral membrane protein MurJ [Vicinamibacterales bacterium]|nr:murein biosynthesis integral membrane protein MurJ [Vicinamibacterales bacterium]
MTERLARSAGLIGLATSTSRVLGLVRDVLVAGYFGTGLAADAFAVATRIPTLLRDLFAEGAMSAAFVPTITRYLKNGGRAAAWRLGSQVVNGLLVVTGAIVLLGIVFADPLTRAFASGFTDTPEKIALTTLLTRVNMPFLLLIAVAAAFMGMLNAVRRFFIPATSPAMFNVVFILCTVVLVPVFERVGVPPIMALSAGMLLGGMAQVVVQWPVLRQEGYRHQWILDPKDRGLREVLILMGPATLGLAAAQINLLVSTSLATGQDGAAAALGYAFRLIYVPIGIVGVSVATAAIPDLAGHAASAALREMRATVSWSLRLMLMLSVPAVVGLMALSGPIVELLFERYQFGPQSRALVADALFFYAPGILGYSAVKIASPGFYSLQNARTPATVSAISILLNLVLNVWLNSTKLQFLGLALGTAIAANVNAGLLLYLLSRRLGGLDGSRVTRAFVKILLASVVMGAAAYYAEGWLHGLLPDPWWLPRAIRVGGAIAVALATLALAAAVLRIEEFGQAMRKLIRQK